MYSPKVINCLNCDAEMEVSSFQNRVLVTCPECGRDYRLLFSEERQSWFLQPEPAVEPEVEARHTENPAAVLGAVGRPKRVDRADKYREQSDLKADIEQAIDKEHRRS